MLIDARLMLTRAWRFPLRNFSQVLAWQRVFQTSLESCQRVALPHGGVVELCRGFVSSREADELLERLLADTPWEQGEITIFGRKVREPRLTAWYGDHDYVYSGRRVSRAPWTETLRELRTRVAARAGGPFNAVLLNRYRDGSDSMGMHSDDERELGKNPLVASLSFGATRRFVLEPKHKSARASGRMTFELGHGDLLVMSGSCQHHYRHGVPKQPAIRAERLNLTFRQVY